MVVVVVCVHTEVLVLSCHLLGPTSGTNFVEPKVNFLAVYVLVTYQGGSICWDPKKAILLVELDREGGSKTVLCCNGKRWLV